MRRAASVPALGWVGVLLASALLVGCGSSSGDPEPGPAAPTDAVLTPAADGAQPSPTQPAPAALPDACALLAKADAELLARTPLEDAVPAPNSCTYTGPVTGPVAQVEVYVGDGAKKMLDIDRDDLGHAFTEVPGIGDEALLEEGAIFVRKGAVWVAIRLVLLNDPAENVAPLEAAARTAAGRM